MMVGVRAYPLPPALFACQLAVCGGPAVVRHAHTCCPRAGIVAAEQELTRALQGGRGGVVVLHNDIAPMRGRVFAVRGEDAWRVRPAYLVEYSTML
jgi:hypothetical protein